MKSFGFPAFAILVLSTLGLALDRTADSQLSEKFRADLAIKVKAADKNNNSVVVGKDGWMFFVPELRHVSVGKFWGEDAKKVSQAVQPQHADPLPAILDFRAQLDKAGVRLLMVLVPPKAVIYADKISPHALMPPSGLGKTIKRYDAALYEFYKVLWENDIELIDLTEEFLQKRGNGLYCKQDTHWSGRGCIEAAQTIASSIASTGTLKLGSKWKYPWKNGNITITGDLWNSLPQGVRRPVKEVLPLRFVGTRDPKNKSMLGPVPTSRNSPVLLMGDSHTLVFHEGGDMHAKGAGLPDQLAHELGFPVDLIGVRGSGATPARVNLMRRVKADPNYLKGKKWIIWVFSAREFTESAGWQKVPIVQ